MADNMFSMGLAQQICTIASQTVKTLSKASDNAKTSFEDVLSGKLDSQIPSAEVLSGDTDEIDTQLPESLDKDIPLLAQAAVNPESAETLLSQTQTDSAVFLLKILKQLLESVAKDINSQSKDDKSGAGDMLTMLFKGSNDNEDDYASENGLFSFLMTPVTQSDLDFMTGDTDEMLSAINGTDMMIDYKDMTGMPNSISTFDLANNILDAKSTLTGRIDELIAQMTAQVQPDAKAADNAVPEAAVTIPEASDEIITAVNAAENLSETDVGSDDGGESAADAVTMLKKQTSVRNAGSELEELIASNTGREVTVEGAANETFSREETLMSVRVQTAEKILGMINEMREQNAPVKELSVTLNPETLGKIAVKVTQESSGISISIAAQNRSTEELIRDSMGNLDSAVRNSADADVQIRIVEASDAAFASGFGLEDYSSQSGSQYDGSGYRGGEQSVNDDTSVSETYVREAALWETA